MTITALFDVNFSCFFTLRYFIYSHKDTTRLDLRHFYSLNSLFFDELFLVAWCDDSLAINSVILSFDMTWRGVMWPDRAHDKCSVAVSFPSFYCLLQISEKLCQLSLCYKIPLHPPLKVIWLSYVLVCIQYFLLYSSISYKYNNDSSLRLFKQIE